MNRLVLVLLLIAAAGCGRPRSELKSPVDGKQLHDTQDFWDPSTGFRYTEWNGHRYVVLGYYGHAGIAHDPDCPYDKKPKPKPEQ